MSSHPPQGFLAVPPAGQGPGVLVLHAWWGLNDTIKSFCERLAAEGFVAFAPDLFHGKVAATREEAEALSSSAEKDGGKQVLASAAAALDYLARHPGTHGPGLGVIGFSFGVDYALRLSMDDPDHVHAVVIFYGAWPLEGYTASQAAYLGHFAETDEFVPAAQVEQLESAVRAAGRPLTFYRYDGAGHWFFEPDRADAYNEKAAALAWERTLAFLKNSLGSRRPPRSGAKASPEL